MPLEWCPPAPSPPTHHSTQCLPLTCPGEGSCRDAAARYHPVPPHPPLPPPLLPLYRRYAAARHHPRSLPQSYPPPSLPLTAGMRRRGITPVAINTFCREIGITRNENIIPMHKLEHHIRLDLDVTSPRTMAVLRPLRVRAAGRVMQGKAAAPHLRLLVFTLLLPSPLPWSSATSPLSLSPPPSRSSSPTSPLPPPPTCFTLPPPFPLPPTIQVVLTNLPESHLEHFEARCFPGAKSSRSGEVYSVPLTRVVYLEETDFKEEDEKDYYGLAPNKSVMLK